MKCQRGRSARLPGQGAPTLPALRLPYSHTPILPTTKQKPAIRTKGDSIDQVRVAAQRPKTPAPMPLLVDLPYLDAIIAATGQQPSGTADDRPDPVGVALQGAQTLRSPCPATDLPEFDGAIKTGTDQQPFRIKSNGLNHVSVL